MKTGSELRWEVVTRDALTEEDVWGIHSDVIWEARRFEGNPAFYPIYRFQDYYSYSPLSLIRLKGQVRVNPRALTATADGTFLYADIRSFIDQDIKRVGGPLSFRRRIKSGEELARRVAEALRQDAGAVERANPGYENVILCGGKDSLNLLLLPWRNPVRVASAAPNYPLVKQFLADNGLGYEIVELQAEDEFLREEEILINCCRNNLEHCRWGGDLRRLAVQASGKVVFWKGQAADALLSPKWDAYRRYTKIIPDWINRGWQRCGSPLQWKGKAISALSGLAQWQLMHTHWNRAAMWQGSHVGMVRELVGALVCSGYHGNATRNVFGKADIARCVKEDVRPLIGRHLLGREVRYPETNPSPPVSKQRAGCSDANTFLRLLEREGVRIVW